MTLSQEPKGFRKFHPNIYFLTATSFLMDVSSEMMHNVLPLFLVNVLGARTGIVGLIDGLAETTASLVKILSGSLSDKTGKRKPLAVLGYGLSTLAKPFLYFASAWGWVLGVRIADRFGKGIRNAPRDALIADSVEAPRRGAAFGLHRAGDTAGAFIGLAIAGVIIWYSQSGNLLLMRLTFQRIVLASILPAILAVVILALGVREKGPAGTNCPAGTNRPAGTILPTESKTQTKPAGSWRSLDRRFKRFIFVLILFTLGNSSDSFLILRGQERGLTTLQLIGMLMTFNAVYSLLSGPAGALSDRLGRRRLILGGWLIYAVIYLGFALAQTGTQVWVLFGFYGLYYAATEGTAKALVADLVAPEQRGTAYGFFNAAVGIAALPASLIAGILWQGIGSWMGFGAKAPFLFGMAMALLAGVLFITWVKPREEIKSPL